jgi:hypothetical protein
VDAELAERDALQFPISWMIFDPLHVAPEPVALVEHRTMAVGQSRAFVEMAAGKFAQPIEMRLEMADQPFREINAQEIGERGIRAEEIHARGIGRKQCRSVGPISDFVLDRLMHV